MKLFKPCPRRSGFSGAQRILYQRIGRCVEAWLQEKGYLRPLTTIEEIAEDIGVEPDQLSAYLHRKNGKNVLGWRKGLRIEEAKRLLLDDPDLTIAAIARRIGIEDKSNFKRQFIESVGLSPHRWREVHRSR
jgi:AraC-like DNA-binding protein